MQDESGFTVCDGKLGKKLRIEDKLGILDLTLGVNDRSEETEVREFKVLDVKFNRLIILDQIKYQIIIGLEADYN